MAEEKKPQVEAKQPAPISWTEFLQAHPPGPIVEVCDAVTVSQTAQQFSFQLKKPDLQLFCPESLCNAHMIFECKNTVGGNFFGMMQENNWDFFFLTYRCRHCQKHSRIIAVTIASKRDGLSHAYKFGEYPPFGPPTPARL